MPGSLIGVDFGEGAAPFTTRGSVDPRIVSWLFGTDSPSAIFRSASAAFSSLLAARMLLTIPSLPVASANVIFSSAASGFAVAAPASVTVAACGVVVAASALPPRRKTRSVPAPPVNAIPSRSAIAPFVLSTRSTSLAAPPATVTFVRLRSGIEKSVLPPIVRSSSAAFALLRERPKTSAASVPVIVSAGGLRIVAFAFASVHAPRPCVPITRTSCASGFCVFANTGVGGVRTGMYSIDVTRYGKWAVFSNVGLADLNNPGKRPGDVDLIEFWRSTGGRFTLSRDLPACD